MKISTKGRYALRMLLDLAQNQGDGYVSLKDIAQRQDVSKKYLEQIVPLLNKSNMLRTNRGYQGGYRLSKARRGAPHHRGRPCTSGMSANRCGGLSPCGTVPDDLCVGRTV